MKKYTFCMLFAALACLTTTNAYAKKNSDPTPEEKGLALINRESAEAFISFLASDELKGREAGTEEGRIAGNYIASLLQQWGVSPLFDSYFQPFEAYRVERQKQGRLQVHPDSIQIIKQGVHQKYNMRNVLAKIEGKNKNEFVIIGAHYDHIGYDPMLDGDQIYNGADDNASGVSAVLQIVRSSSPQDSNRNVPLSLLSGMVKRKDSSAQNTLHRLFRKSIR